MDNQSQQNGDSARGHVGRTEDSRDKRERQRLQPGHLTAPVENLKRFTCKECGFATANPRYIKIHLLRHSDNKPYKCDQCDYAAVQKTHLSIHMMGHAANSPLKCRQCGFSTEHKFVLTKHMAVHQENKTTKSNSATPSSSTSTTSTGQDLCYENEPEIHNKPVPSSKNQNTLTSHTTAHDDKEATNMTSPVAEHVDTKASQQTLVRSKPETKQDRRKRQLKTQTKKTLKPQNASSVKGEVSRGGRDKRKGYRLQHGLVTRPLQKHKQTTLHKRFVCKECGFATADKYYLKKHILRHRDNKPYKCDQCDYTAIQKTHLNIHMLGHAANSPLKCRQCGFSTEHKFVLTKHMAVHREKKTMKSNIVTPSSSTSTGQDLCHEIEPEIHNKPVPSTKNQNSLTSHTTARGDKEATNVANMTSPVAEHGDTNASNKLLVKSEPDTKQNRVTKKQKKQLKKQTKKKLKRRNVSNVKGEVSVATRPLQKHKPSTLHKRFVCKECGFATADKYYLRRHLHRHSGDTPFKCDQCGFAAITNNQLLAHGKRHTGIYLLKCTECSFSTDHQYLLTRHMAVHRGKPNKSDDVTPSSSQDNEATSPHVGEQLLGDQSESETNNKPTPSGNRRSQTKKKVNNHTNVTTTVKPEVSQDETDSKERQQSLHGRFSEASNNKQTAWNVNKPFVCEECGFATAFKKNLKRHMLRHSGPSPSKRIMRRHTKKKVNYASDSTTVKSEVSQDETDSKEHQQPLHGGFSETPKNKQTVWNINKPFVCKECGFATAFKKNLKRHMLRHSRPSQKYRLKCTECSFSTNHQTTITKHMAVHKGKETNKSDNASTSEDDEHSTALSHRQATQNGKSKYKTGKKSTPSKCKQKVYSDVRTEKAGRSQQAINNSDTPLVLNSRDRYELRDKPSVVKQDIHTEEKPRKRRKRNAEEEKCVRRRIKPSASNLPKPFKCEQCVYSTNDVNEFDRHLFQHSSLCAKRFLCGQCSFATSKKSHWDNHTLKHSETKQFACNECNFRTNYRFSLSGHVQRRHALQKPKNDKQATSKFSPPKSPSYKQMYRMSFSKRSSLYTCKKCKYATALKVAILRHVESHAREKPQNCKNDSDASDSGKQVSDSRASNRRTTVP
ncbi:ZNF729 [Branchiostoma lanceolatum]|uniref:ZNF729 protein n=1 Tax=Branchiostoma lanceolatum TaxID=7740 RepID=A0A8K0ECG5_BRALA|nr:ZNF729 [Branchiostoma lanceolatum]